MPELPEVQALVDFLTEHAVGEAVTGVELGSITVLKTYAPPPDALIGAPVESVTRHGALRGAVMAMARLSKCGPWHPGGYDPVRPERRRDLTSTNLKEF